MTTNRLYRLLPAAYRLRDVSQGEPLRALLSLIEEQYAAVEGNIAGLYEDWFIETCQEWVVPYIGDLFGVRSLYPVSPGTFSARAYVAHTLGYRRRKGTAAMLEQLAADVTGWPARVVEYFDLLATTQYMNHLRPHNVVTPDLRRVDALDLFGGSFESTPHTADVRHIARKRGRYNIPNIGIFLWRLTDYLVGPISTDPGSPARQGDARAVASAADGRFTFHPLGLDSPLANRARTETDTARLAGEINVPGLLPRRPLYEELEQFRTSKENQQPPPDPVYFGPNPAFELRADGQTIPFEQVMISDLTDDGADWRRPSPSKTYVPAGGGQAVSLPIAVAVDPARGRIAFPAGVKPRQVEVSHTYCFSGNVGAGTYDRSAWLNDEKTRPGALSDPKRWQVVVSRAMAPVPGLVLATLKDAVAAWNQRPAGSNGVIAVADNHSYREDLSGSAAIVIPEGSRLLLVAADWPHARTAGTTTSLRLEPNGLRSHLIGNLSVRGTASAGSVSPGEMAIDGFLLEGSVVVENGNLGVLSLSHSTVPPTGKLAANSSGAAGGDNSGLDLRLYRAICGPVSLNANVPRWSATDTLVTSGPVVDLTANAVSAPGAEIRLLTTTILGSTVCRLLQAGNCIFAGAVKVERR